MRKSIILAVLMTVALTARADNKADTLYVTTTPQMHCANCENKIKNNLRFEKGVKKIETSVADQREAHQELRQVWLHRPRHRPRREGEAHRGPREVR